MSTSKKSAKRGTITERDPRWAAVAACDPEANFYYSVETTGVYCRPSCAARLARPENVQFYSAREDAEQAGFRPCKRCKPDQTSGMTRSNYRAGGDQTDIRFAVGECSFGSILVAQSGHGVCAIFLGEDPNSLVREPQDQFPKANLIGGDAGFEWLVAKVVGFLEAPVLGINLCLDVRGTAFQQRGWQALRKIPAGSTASYAGVAKLIASPDSVRAVAQACGANTLALAIPCHRAVRSDGAVSGYRRGVDRKRTLLTKETHS